MIRRVFLSHTSEFSTYPKEESFVKAAIDAVNRAGCVPCDMAYFVARDQQPAQFCIDRVRESDVYVGIIGLRYGSPVRDRPEVSYIELEFEAASMTPAKTRLIFLLDPDAEVPASSFTDRKYHERQETFCRRLQDAGVTWKSFRKADELKTYILQALLEGSTGSEKKSVDQERIEWPRDKSPYPGLEWFDEGYAPLFFGRDREVTQLVGKLGEPGGRFLVISGASGSGKSSLVEAGLWQALIKEGRLPGSQSWKWLRITPAADSRGPWASLAAGLHHALPKLTVKAEALTHALASEPTAFATHIIPQLSLGQELVLVVDQLEELFTQASPSADVRFFLDRLVILCGDRQNRLRVVATIRGEFFGQLAESESVTRMINEGFQMLVRPMELMALHDMIQKPAAATGYVFETGLVDTILRDAVKDPGNLPLVAYALKQLYEQRRGRTFTHAAYQAMGGIVGAIGTKAEQVIATLGQKAGALLDKVFAELVHIERDRPPTPKRARLSQFQNDEDARKIIQLLAGPECRVLMTSCGDCGETVEVSHEALILQWQRLQEWLNEYREFLLWRERLRARMSERQYTLHDEDTLLRGAVLVEAQHWLSERADMLTAEEQSYIGHSVAAQERAVLAEQQRVEHELAQANRLAEESAKREEAERARAEASERARRRQRLFSVTLLILLLVGGIVIWLWQNGYTFYQAVRKVQLAFVTIHVPPEMVPISGGTFQRSDLEKVGEARRDPVAIKPFSMGKYEVTFEEYDWFAIATGRRLPEDLGWGRGKRPVINVSWEDVEAYALWLSRETGQRYRLPSEAEWEYAAQSGAKQQAWAGTSEEFDLRRYAVFAENSGNRTAEVGTKLPNEFGLYDMSGNVWEWVENCPYSIYEKAPGGRSASRKDDKGECKLRVIRGGSWSLIPEYLSASFRFRCTSGLQSSHLGFRLVQDIS